MVHLIANGIDLMKYDRDWGKWRKQSISRILDLTKALSSGDVGQREKTE